MSRIDDYWDNVLRKEDGRSKIIPMPSKTLKEDINNNPLKMIPDTEDAQEHQKSDDDLFK